jgi:hypothetical protein
VLMLLIVMVVEGEDGGQRSEGKHRTSSRNSVAMRIEGTSDRRGSEGRRTPETLKSPAGHKNFICVI